MERYPGSSYLAADRDAHSDMAGLREHHHLGHQSASELYHSYGDPRRQAGYLSSLSAYDMPSASSSHPLAWQGSSGSGSDGYRFSLERPHLAVSPTVARDDETYRSAHSGYGSSHHYLSKNDDLYLRGVDSLNSYRKDVTDDLQYLQRSDAHPYLYDTPGDRYRQNGGSSSYPNLQPDVHSLYVESRDAYGAEGSYLSQHIYSEYSFAKNDTDLANSYKPQSDFKDGGGGLDRYGEQLPSMHMNEGYPNGQVANPSGETKAKKKRQSRWEPIEEATEKTVAEGSRKRKSRWANDEPKIVLPEIKLPEFMKQANFDPAIFALNARLAQITKKLQTGHVIEEGPNGERSPSPEPIYDNLGLRVNSREARAREKLLEERTIVISELVKKNPQFKPPSDYKHRKFQRKLVVPVEEHPNYNFIGIIIGPRGHTLKTMEKESGAKICIRGKGSRKEGNDSKSDNAEKEGLHVLIEAENGESLDKAVAMVEKLLVPIEEGQNEHKREQLRMLAAIKGTLRDDETCKACGEVGHMQSSCPGRLTAPMSKLICAFCGLEGHAMVDCSKKSNSLHKFDENKSTLTRQKRESDPGAVLSTLKEGKGSGLVYDGGVSVSASSASKIINAAKEGKGSLPANDSYLHVNCLPKSIDEEGLSRFFSSFGEIANVIIVKDPLTGASWGSGVVKFSDADTARQAAALTNGFVLDGSQLEVKLAGGPAGSVNHPPQQTTYTGSAWYSGQFGLSSALGTSQMSPYNFYNPSSNHYAGQ